TRHFLQALETDSLEVARRPWIQECGANRLVVQHLPFGLASGFTPERRTSGQHLIQDRAKRVDVRSGAHLSTTRGLLWGHVAGCAHPPPRERYRGFGGVIE